MLVEIANPITFVLCILALYALFYAAFLNPANDLQQRIWDALGKLALAGGTSVLSGLLFREEMPDRHGGSRRLTATLPVQMFCWAVGVMLILFFISWYLHNYCVLYRDVRF
jgi:hypothetical protein